MDHVAHAPHAPVRGESVVGTGFGIFPGGKGANQAVAAARLGAKVAFSGCVGLDTNGDLLLETMRGAGVDTSFVKATSKAATGAAVITIEPCGSNRIVVCPGANMHLDLQGAMEAVDADDWDFVLLQFEIPTSTNAGVIAACRQRGIPTILNPAPFDVTAIPAQMDLVVLNEIEAEQMTGQAIDGESGLRSCEDAIKDRGASAALITLGARGCWCENVLYPAPVVEAIDTTGAGDAFCGALATFMAEGLPRPEAIKSAVRYATLSTTRHGAMPSLPSRSELM